MPDLAPYAGVMQVGLWLAIGGLAYGALRWLVSLGGSKEEAKQAEALEEARDEAFSDEEKWDAAGGLVGAIKRGMRKRR